MKRLAVCGFAALVVGLVLAPSALGATGLRQAALGAQFRHAQVSAVGRATAPGVNFQRLGDTTYAISGHVLDYGGDPVSGAEVDWGWWDNSGGYHFGNYDMTSDPIADPGSFTFPAVTTAPSAGEDDLTAWYPMPNGAPASIIYKLEFWANDFATTSDFALQPGEVTLNVSGLNVAQADDMADVWVAGIPGSAESFAMLSGGTGTAFAAPSSFNDATIGFFDSTGAITSATQWQGADVSVTAGSPAASSVSLVWSAAHQAQIAGPLCRQSGKPGSVVKMSLANWPAGQQATFYASGYSRNWILTPSPWTSTGAAHTISLKIPTGAGVQPLEVHAYRSDAGELYSMPNLFDLFQVCTFKASANAVRLGGAIRLSGKVPGGGKVTIFWRHSRAAQPATLAAKGWVKGGSYSIKASGAFRTGLLYPARTTWFVAKYQGDFRAFTSVIKVTVRR